MRCFIALLFTVALVVSCQRKPSFAPPVMPEPEAVDSLKNDEAPEVMAEEPEPDVPESADEFFDDFIYSFTRNKAYQLRRIKFPLPVTTNGATAYLEKESWQYSRFHANEPLNVVVFDSKESLDLEKSDQLHDVWVERFNMENDLVRRYHFQKTDEEWWLVKIEKMDIESYTDHDFITFYQRFATDDNFQKEHLKSTISLGLVEPNDAGEDMSGTIDNEQWPYFCPELPHDAFSSIDYGQSAKMKNRRVVAIEGSSDGFLCLLFFVREDGKWKLYRMED